VSSYTTLPRTTEVGSFGIRDSMIEFKASRFPCANALV